MVNYTDDTADWQRRAREQEPPYGWVYYHGVKVLTTIVDKDFHVRPQIASEGFVVWRIVNPSSRLLPIGVRAESCGKLFEWDATDPKAANEEIVEFHCSVRGTDSSIVEHCYQKDLSVPFRSVGVGVDTVKTVVNDDPAAIAESQFVMLRDDEPHMPASERGPSTSSRRLYGDLPVDVSGAGALVPSTEAFLAAIGVVIQRALSGEDLRILMAMLFADASVPDDIVPGDIETLQSHVATQVDLGNKRARLRELVQDLSVQTGSNVVAQGLLQLLTCLIERAG